jgi:hypothetical protein
MEAVCSTGVERVRCEVDPERHPWAPRRPKAIGRKGGELQGLPRRYRTVTMLRGHIVVWVTCDRIIEIPRCRVIRRVPRHLPPDGRACSMSECPDRNW